jgi:hypothetical protein
VTDIAYAQKSRRHRNTLLLALLGILLATAIFADRVFFGEDKQPAHHVLPKSRSMPKVFARSESGHHGVTLPIGHPAAIGRGGPEDPGEWIAENGGSRRWFFSGGRQPIDGFAQAAFTLPDRSFKVFSTPVGGFGGFPGGIGIGGGGSSGGGGGGSGGGSGGGGGAGSGGGSGNGSGGTGTGSGDGGETAIADKSPPPGIVVDDGDNPQQTEIVVIDSNPHTPDPFSGPNEGTPPKTIGDLAAGPNTQTPSSSSDEPAPGAAVPVSAVPEPQSWVTMIAGFLLMGLALRSLRLRPKPRAARARG